MLTYVSGCLRTVQQFSTSKFANKTLLLRKLYLSEGHCEMARNYLQHLRQTCTWYFGDITYPCFKASSTTYNFSFTLVLSVWRISIAPKLMASNCSVFRMSSSSCVLRTFNSLTCLSAATDVCLSYMLLLLLLHTNHSIQAKYEILSATGYLQY